MRVLFAAGSAIALPCLQALQLHRGIRLAGVLTVPPEQRGKSRQPREEAIREAAGDLAPEVPLLMPKELDAAAREAVARLAPDVLVSFAYGRIYGPRFLALFPSGAFNVHPSLLPKYRGASPIPAAIMHREAESGVTIQHLALPVDSGAIVAQTRFKLYERETAQSLSRRAGEAAAQLLEQLLERLLAGTLAAQAQDEREATYCRLLSSEDGRVDWRRPAAEIDAQVRALTPWPRAWTTHRGKRLYILEAAPAPQKTAAREAGEVLGSYAKEGILVQAGEGVLGVTELQFEAKKALGWQEFLNGARGFLGARLGEEYERSICGKR